MSGSDVDWEAPLKPTEATRFVQIAANGQGGLFALDDAGVVWMYIHPSMTWERFAHHEFCDCVECEDAP